MQLSRQQWATAIAIAFHLSGFIAIGLLKSQLFVQLTPLNLLVSAGLLCWTQPKFTTGFWLFAAVAFTLGFFAEVVGVNTGLLFGNYTYGPVLGPKWRGVPYLIGLQWVVVTYCAGVAMAMLHHKLLPAAGGAVLAGPSRFWRMASVVVDGALLAVFFDWILEPVAVQLGYWSWAGNEIPLLNYTSWMGVSMVILLFFYIFRFPRHNLFAIHLFMIQVLFFLLMRTFGQ
jgi:putative membrane protein